MALDFEDEMAGNLFRWYTTNSKAGKYGTDVRTIDAHLHGVAGSGRAYGIDAAGVFR